MSRTLVVSNTPYTFPDAGASPPWGASVTDWAQAITDHLNTLTNGNDILNNSSTIGNNVSSATDITGLSFDPTLVRGAIIDYTIYRTSSTIATDKSETGQIFINWDGTSWDLARYADADTGVTFSITAGGQFQYTSTDVGATSYSGNVQFSARTKSQ